MNALVRLFPELAELLGRCNGMIPLPGNRFTVAYRHDWALSRAIRCGLLDKLQRHGCYYAVLPNDPAVARQSPQAGGSADHRHGFPCDLCGAKTFEESGNLCRGFEGCPGDSMSKKVFEKPNNSVRVDE
jgi:hypothetical protein